MKKLLLILFLISNFLYSQETKKVIETQFLDYTDLIVKRDFKTALDKYANDHFFEFVSKEQLLAAFEMLFNNPEMEFYFGEAKINSIDLIDKKINNESYAKIMYSQSLGMKFNEIENIKDVEEKKEKVKMYLYTFQNQFGDENVKYNEKTGFYDLVSQKYCVANSKDGLNWKFTVAEKKQKFLLEKFIPLELLTELK